MTHSDEDAVREALDSVAHISSNRRAAKILGVSEATVRRWRSGNITVPLREPTRSALERYLVRHKQRGEVAGGTVSEGAYPESDEFEGLLSSLDEVMRTLRKIDPEPGGQTARKKDALRLMKELMATLGESLPEWFWDIQERVERGEL